MNLVEHATLTYCYIQYHNFRFYIIIFLLLFVTRMHYSLPAVPKFILQHNLALSSTSFPSLKSSCISSLVLSFYTMLKETGFKLKNTLKIQAYFIQRQPFIIFFSNISQKHGHNFFSSRYIEVSERPHLSHTHNEIHNFIVIIIIIIIQYSLQKLWYIIVISLQFSPGCIYEFFLFLFEYHK